MRAEDLLERLNDKPFEPFRMHLSDGTTVDVSDPGMAMVSRSTIFLPKRFGKDEEGRPLAEGWRKIALIHVVQLTGVEESADDKARPASA